MKKCYIKKINKEGKIYFRVYIPYGEDKFFDFAVSPLFLSKKQFITLLRVSEPDKELEVKPNEQTKK